MLCSSWEQEILQEDENGTPERLKKVWHDFWDYLKTSRRYL